MTYQYDHPDSDLFNEKTLGDYIVKKLKEQHGNQRPDQTDRSTTDSQGSSGQSNR